VTAGRRFRERRLHFHHMQSIEHVECEIALKRWNTDWLYRHTQTLERVRRRLDHRRYFGINRPKTRLDQPAHA
jgi:hypothetical protein